MMEKLTGSIEGRIDHMLQVRSFTLALIDLSTHLYASLALWQIPSFKSYFLMVHIMNFHFRLLF